MSEDFNNSYPVFDTDALIEEPSSGVPLATLIAGGIGGLALVLAFVAIFFASNGGGNNADGTTTALATEEVTEAVENTEEATVAVEAEASEEVTQEAEAEASEEVTQEAEAEASEEVTQEAEASATPLPTETQTPVPPTPTLSPPTPIPPATDLSLGAIEVVDVSVQDEQRNPTNEIVRGNTYAYYIQIARADITPEDNLTITASQGGFPAQINLNELASVDCSQAQISTLVTINVPAGENAFVVYCAPQTDGEPELALTVSRVDGEGVVQQQNILPLTLTTPSLPLTLTQQQDALEPIEITDENQCPNAGWTVPEGAEAIPFTLEWLAPNAPGLDRRYFVEMTWDDPQGLFSVEWTERDCRSFTPVMSGDTLQFQPDFGYVMRLYVSPPANNDFSTVSLPVLNFVDEGVDITINEEATNNYQVLPLVYIESEQSRLTYIQPDVSSESSTDEGSPVGNFYFAVGQTQDTDGNVWLQATNGEWFYGYDPSLFRVIGDLSVVPQVDTTTEAEESSSTESEAENGE